MIFRCYIIIHNLFFAAVMCKTSNFSFCVGNKKKSFVTKKMQNKNMEVWSYEAVLKCYSNFLVQLLLKSTNIVIEQDKVKNN